MPRLYHTKSRTGCRRCRERRVKCDETHPTCGSCTRHNVVCDYDRLSNPNVGSQPASSSHSRQSTTSSAESISVVEPLTAETKERRLMEMGLLHYFSTNVAATVAGEFLGIVRDAWTVDVPKLALKYEPLLNTILILSLLHIEANGYMGLALIDDPPALRARYRYAAQLEHHQTIGNGELSKESAEAVSFASILISYDMFISLRERKLEPYEPPVHWLLTCKGLMKVFSLNKDISLRCPESIIPVAIEINATLVEPAIIFCEANRTRFPYLVERHQDDSESDVDHEAYLDTLCYIGAMMGALEAGENIGMLTRRVIVFSILLPSRFLELLKQLKPRALVILAHFFAIASHCRQSWLVRDTPAKEIQAIDKYLGPDWRNLMEWPLKSIT